MKSLPFQRWFYFGEKPEVTWCQVLAVRRLSHLDDLMFHQKTLHETWYIKWVRCHDEAANQQLPIAGAFWIIQIVSMEECSRWMQNLMQIHGSTCSFLMQQPHSTHAHSSESTTPTDWLVQWSCHCSRMRVPVHSPWLPGYVMLL